MSVFNECFVSHLGHFDGDNAGDIRFSTLESRLSLRSDHGRQMLELKPFSHNAYLACPCPSQNYKRCNLFSWMTFKITGEKYVQNGIISFSRFFR